MAIQFGNRLLLSKAKAFSSRNNAFFFSFFFFFHRFDTRLSREERRESMWGTPEFHGSAMRFGNTQLGFLSSPPSSFYLEKWVERYER